MHLLLRNFVCCIILCRWQCMVYCGSQEIPVCHPWSTPKSTQPQRHKCQPSLSSLWSLSSRVKISQRCDNDVAFTLRVRLELKILMYIFVLSRKLRNRKLLFV